ncbi:MULTISPECIES: CHAD domain-containing protein [unclassified Flavobacterium]|uniref:CHAD domain-containing protein n=2 Tax=Flavobacterium TaxID=237 RepID=UPI0025BB2408|nr:MULTISPECIES: CHAD domain-containing protein [unclassified Flavobacterium]
MKALTEYFKNREDDISFLLQKSARAYTPVTFHKLRVEIKKVNAFFELINFCSKDFKRKKTFKPFKLIFRHTGKVRELQVEEAMLKKYFLNNLLKEYKNSLKKLRLKERKDFFAILNKTFIARLKKTFREIVPFLKKMDKKKVKSYMEKKIKKIEKLLNQNTLQTPEAHELRKRLKKFHYCRKILNLEKQNKPLPKKDDLLELLGNWHDLQVIIRNLKKAIDTAGINPKEVSQLKKIKTKFSSDSELLFNKIKVVIPTSEFFVMST